MRPYEIISLFPINGHFVAKYFGEGENEPYEVDVVCLALIKFTDDHPCTVIRPVGGFGIEDILWEEDEAGQMLEKVFRVK